MNSYIDWQKAIREVTKDAIGEDFILMNSIALADIPTVPFKVDVTAIVLCRHGRLEGKISLSPIRADAPSLIVLLADKVLEMHSVSADFEGEILIMSRRFTDNLLTDMKDRLPLTLSVENNPCRPLGGEAMHSLETCFAMMRSAIRRTENPDRMEVVRHLMLAFMYGLRCYFHTEKTSISTPRNELIAEEFLALVRHNFSRERLLKFYADRLCLTSKHVAKVIKKTTGKAANEWIDDHVILEAKALLRSTDKTVQQISDSLNFDNASFFAKYFKRHVGETPTEYRNR